MYTMRKARIEAQPAESRQRAADPTAYFDPRFRAAALKVLPGEYIVTDSDVMLVTVLGSCVSACLRDPVAGVGGMNHFMLPDTTGGGAAGESARYGSYAMEVLINELLKRGAMRRNLEAKVFGGGAVLPGFTVNNVGQRNGRFVLDYLKADEIPVVAQDLFDVYPRRVHYFPLSGRVLVRRLPSANEPEVLASEGLYRSRLRQAPVEGTVELFE
ncbi:chemoreceptor glutamine deamidase CheD [Nevskia soli]|uniref:chemoreceptor glutamine deamidase CheD n=1 Tax=Nevskia soli TaxID=418856 RepID=UPI0004A75C74|nr:chemoreceptor glutamine deamidase CheD [Nevskia soli]